LEEAEEEQMKKRGRCITFLFAASLVLSACFHNVSPDSSIPRITKEELKSMLDNPDVVVIDVRHSNDWNSSASKIKGAVREDLEKEVKSWAEKYPKDKTLIFYCS
jgi:predicted sulfurtransferase